MAANKSVTVYWRGN